MNKVFGTYRVVVGVICFAIVCVVSCKNTPDAKDIVLESLEAHGGIEKWKTTKELSYIKTTILYDSLGNVEKKIVQKHRNIFKPQFEAQMDWIEDSISKKVVLKNDTAAVYFDDILQNDQELQKKYYKAIIAANYVIWQPYKLLDKEVTLSYLGEEIIQGHMAKVVKASYFNSDGSPANTWWYYFDQKTNRLLGNMVHHGSTFSYIKNTKYENETGLFLNAERKSYMTDSVRNSKFLKAHYTYEILNLKY